MAKMTQYFDSVKELNAYYPNGVGNQVLAFVKDDSGNYVLYTSTNDPTITGSDSGSGDPVGGYVTSPEDEARIDDLEETKADKADVYTKSEVDEMIEDIDVDLTGYATESYVVSKIEDVVGAAPAALDTLKEIGDSLNNDADFAGTMTAALAAKANANDVYTKSAMDSILADYATEEFATIPVYDSNRGYVRYRQMGKTMQLIGAAEMKENGYDEDGNVVATYFVLDDMASKSYVANYVSTYGGGSQVQANWNESDSTADSYILNKPLTSDANYIYINKAVKYAWNGTTDYNASIYKTMSGLQYNSSWHTFTNSDTGGQIILSLNNARKAYLYGVGDFTGNNFNASHDLAYVINDIQTTLGTAASVASIIVGNNS